MRRHPKLDGDGPPPLPGERRSGCFNPMLITLLVIGGVMFIGLMVVAVLVETGLLTSSVLERGEDLSGRTRRVLEDAFLDSDETVVWFYSAALIDAAEDGNVLTDERVVSYWADPDSDSDSDSDSGTDAASNGDDLFMTWIYLEDVAAIRVDYSDTVLADSEVRIWQPAWTDEESETSGGGADDMLVLFLAPDEDLDHEFIEDLIRMAREHGAPLISIELGGDLLPGELARIDGAVVFDGTDWDAAPTAFIESEKR